LLQKQYSYQGFFFYDLCCIFFLKKFTPFTAKMLTATKLVVLALALVCDSVIGGGLRKLNAMELATDDLPVNKRCILRRKNV